MVDLGGFFGNSKEDQFWIPTKLVAERFGILPAVVRQHKANHSEFIDGVDYIYSMVKIEGRNRKVLLWSKSGINKLSHIIRTEEAKEHRELTTIDSDMILAQIKNVLDQSLKPISLIEERVTALESNYTSPVEYSKLQKRFNDKRYELYKKGHPWHEVHELAKGWTGLAKYDHMNIGQIQEGIRRIETAIGGT